MALLADGNTDRIEIASDSSWQSWQQATILFWFYQPSSLADGNIFSYPWDGADRFQGYVNAGASPLDRLEFGDYVESDDYSVWTSADSIVADKWICAACVIDLTDTTHTAHAYLGDLTTVLAEDSATQSNVSQSRTYTMSGTLYLMNASADNVAHLHGRLACFMFWDEALTLTQLISYQFRPRHDRTSCKIFMLPGFRGATTVPDLSGTGNAGTGYNLAVADHVPLGPSFGMVPWVPMPATVTVTGTASISGSGALAAAGLGIIPGVTAMSGAGALTAAGLGIVLATASMVGTGTLTATGLGIVLGAAGLTGDGALTATGLGIVPGVTALAGAGALSATGLGIVLGASALSGEGALSAAGLGIVLGVAPLAGEGTLSAAASVIILGTGTLTGDGTLAASALLIVPGTAELTGTGTLTLTLEELVTGTASISGAGSLASSGLVQVLGAGVLAGVGALSAVGGVIPTDRIYVIDAEGRTWTVSTDTRIYVIDLESRTLEA